MKRHNKARKAIELSAVIILASAILGACAENVQKQKIPAATYMGGKASITGICKELDAAGASHVDLFQEWVVDFADSAGKNAKLEDAWSDPAKMKADIVKCMDDSVPFAGWDALLGVNRRQLYRHIFNV